MKIPRAPHAWSVTPTRAVEIQRTLASRVGTTPPGDPIRFVAGVDAAFTAQDTVCVAAAVLWDVERRTVVEERLARRELDFPYILGLLSFREAPAVLAALRKIRAPVDGVLCDGHGLAHPRRFGLACHVGVLCGAPTLGCAKSLLVGEHRPLALRRGARVPLIDRGEIVGSVLRTQAGVRPIYVSVGHAIDLKSAERLVLETAVRSRLPEPTRLADRVVARASRAPRPEARTSPPPAD